MSKEIPICVSAPTLLPKALFFLYPFFRIEELTKYAQTAGYEQIEWRPLLGISNQQLLGVDIETDVSGIASAEQSFLSEKSFQQSLRHRNPLIAVASYITFPHRIDSLRALAGLQMRNPQIPVTIYPAQNEEEEILQSKLQNKLIQPSQEIVERWKLESFDHMMQHFYDRRLGINLDLFHYLRLADSFSLPSIRDAAKVMSPLIQEVQYSANRVDFAQTASTSTVQAFKDLLNGSNISAEMKLFQEVLDQGFRGPVVSEILPALLNPLTVFTTHQTVSRNLKAIVR